LLFELLDLTALLLDCLLLRIDTFLPRGAPRYVINARR